MEINLCTLAKHFSDEDAAYELVEQMRWPNGPVCPHCGEIGRAYFLKARSGHRTTSTGAKSYRRLWKCAACRRQFSVLVGTIFEASKVPLSKWLLAIYLMNASKNGVAAYELHRTLGVTNKTAWFMLHRIREAMKAGPVADMLRGTIVADETFIGGKLGNKHRQGKTPGRVGQRGQANAKGKIPVLSLINEQTGEVRSRIIPDVTGATLRKAIAEGHTPQVPRISGPVRRCLQRGVHRSDGPAPRQAVGPAQDVQGSAGLRTRQRQRRVGPDDALPTGEAWAHRQGRPRHVEAASASRSFARGFSRVVERGGGIGPAHLFHNQWSRALAPIFGASRLPGCPLGRSPDGFNSR